MHNRNVHYFDCGNGFLWENKYVKIYLIIFFKHVEFIVYELHSYKGFNRVTLL